MSLPAPEPGDLLGHRGGRSRGWTRQLEGMLARVLLCLPGSAAPKRKGLQDGTLQDAEVICELELIFSE